MAAPGVVVTRDEGQNGPLGRLLRERGFRVHYWPTIRIAPPADPGPLEAALAELGSFDWAVFTSPRAVAAVVERLSATGTGRAPAHAVGAGDPSARASGETSGAGAGLRVAAVGESTADALRDAGWPVHLVPAVQTGAALLEALLEEGAGAGAKVFFPASAIARETVPAGLAAAGATVVQVEAYRTEPAALDRGACREALESRAVGLVTFTSPSTVENLVAALGPALTGLARARTRAVAIGPTTGAAAERAGFDVVVASPYSLDGLAERVAAAARAE